MAWPRKEGIMGTHPSHTSIVVVATEALGARTGTATEYAGGAA